MAIKFLKMILIIINKHYKFLNLPNKESKQETEKIKKNLRYSFIEELI